MTELLHSTPSLREEQLPGGAHTSLILRKGQILRLTDIDGGANVSMMMLNPHEKSERLNLPDTLKCELPRNGLPADVPARVAATVPRDDKWLAQTPQMFRIGALRRALEHVGAAATDEASAMEAMGLRPRLVPGGAQNFKVTYPDDFALAEAVLAQRMHGATLERFGGARGAAASEPAQTFFSSTTPRQR